MLSAYFRPSSASYAEDATSKTPFFFSVSSTASSRIANGFISWATPDQSHALMVAFVEMDSEACMAGKSMHGLLMPSVLRWGNAGTRHHMLARLVQWAQGLFHFLLAISLSFPSGSRVTNTFPIGLFEGFSETMVPNRLCGVEH